MKILINVCFGGFSVSETVYKKLGIKWDGYGFLSNEDLGIKSDNDDEYRADERLIKAVEKLGIEASENDSELKIVEIPDDMEWEIDEYDGKESVHEKHRVWY